MLTANVIKVRRSVTHPTLREKAPNTEFFSGLYFPVFGLSTGKYRPEKTPYLDTFHAVQHYLYFKLTLRKWVYFCLNIPFFKDQKMILNFTKRFFLYENEAAFACFNMCKYVTSQVSTVCTTYLYSYSLIQKI